MVAPSAGSLKRRRLEADTRSHMPQKDESERPKLNLNAAQVAGGAMAAVTAAVAASRFGVGGTLIGAALASVVSSTGSAFYTHMLRRTGSGVRHALDEPITRRLPHHNEGADSRDGSSPPPAQQGHDGRPTATLPEQPEAPPPSARSRHLPAWAVPVLATVLVFAIAVGAITCAEALTGRPAASWTGGPSPSSGTTVGSVVSGGSAATPTPSPSAAPTSAPSAAPATPGPAQQPEASPSAQPTAMPGNLGSGPSPATQPSAGEPSTPQPQPSGGGLNTPGGQ